MPASNGVVIIGKLDVTPKEILVVAGRFRMPSDTPELEGASCGHTTRVCFLLS
jgi:hypothetical protein